MARGQSQRDEDTNSLSSKGAVKKMKDINDSSISGSPTNASRLKSKVSSGKAKDSKDSAATSSAATDSSPLRRSARETPTKKSSTSSSSSRKSERLEKQNTLTPLKKRSSEKERKKRPRNLLRRSERIEKFCAPSSSGLKLSGKSSSSAEKKKKKKINELKNGKKTSVLGTTKENKSKKHNSSSTPKRKRMDARSYKALFTPVAKKLKISGSTEMPHGSDSRAAGSAEVLGGGDECSGRKCDKSNKKFSHEELEEAAEGSSSESRELAKLAQGVDRDARSACHNMKHKHIESSESKENGYSVFQREIDCDDNGTDQCKLNTEDLLTLQPEVPASQDRPLDANIVAESGGGSASLKNAKRTYDDHSDSSIRLQEDHNLVKVSSTTDACLSSPSLTKMENLEHCTRPNCSVASAGTISVHMPVEETRVRLDCDLIDISKECISSTVLKESLVKIQTDVGPNACDVCKLPETELSCDGKGCNRSYHLSCLDPPLQYTPPGVWLCIFCIKRKIEFGVYSVSEGIESVWNFKEGVQNGKHYLVKYKGLAHVHNQWISETQILQEAPPLLSKFNRKHHKERAIRWKEWTEPHRLLQKRLLMPRKLADEFFDGFGKSFPKCYHEWLVKWKGLGYEDATWELESSPFLCTPEAMKLMKDYEARIEAKAAFDSSNADKALEFRTNRFDKLTRLPDDFPPGLDYDHLNSINRLHEFWHRNQNTVFIDDQERVTKSILFLLSLQSYACRPFLIISPCTSLSSWETQFNRLAPLINLVVYDGSKDVRKMIRTLEFYEGSGRIMFQVLLSHPDAILEDFETLEFIAWEALIVDECQNSRVSKHLESLKHLSTGFRLLLLSCQLKDNVAEYLNLLSFLDSGIDGNLPCTAKFDSTDAVGALLSLKEKLSRYISFDRKPDSSKFLEYWVPVRLSNVQLEQYCATLILKSMPLRACAKIDLVGALGDIVISTRKCCDHPYLIDEHLQSSLMKGHPVTEILDVGVNASGKLLVLDKILSMVQKQGLRVLILFQSIDRAGATSLGDILDDFIRQRFGADSYERVDRGLAVTKRLAALNMFNDKANGRFVFLIENRACLPSIKLSSVDAIIVYNSDWNPLNDLRALQKITIESQQDYLVVFRLYSSFTLEERLLMFAKQDTILDSNINNISPSVCHSLLSWGASNLFRRLDEFHQLDYSDNCPQSPSVEMLLINDVLEILTKSSIYDPSKISVLIRAQQSGASYSRNIILAGEKEGASSLDKDPHSFWSSLLDGRYPLWRYISESSHSQRSRRKIHNLDDSAIPPEPENDEPKKKRKKALSSGTVDPISSESWPEERREAEGNNNLSGNNNRPSLSSLTKAASVPNSLQMETEAQAISQENLVSHAYPMSEGISDVNKPNEIDLEGREKLRAAQRSLHDSLKPELSKLCEILTLPEDVKEMALVFLEYIMNNHHVSPEPEMILQAFKISLCWRAASFLKHKIDHKESLALAKKYLNFSCNEEQASNVYSKLRILKKKFLHRNSALRSENEPNAFEPGPSVSGKDLTAEPIVVTSSNSAASNLHEFENGGLRESTKNSVLDQRMLPEQEQVPVLGTPEDLHEHLGSLNDELLKNRIDLINKICSRREEELFLKQQQEISDFDMHKENMELNLKKAHDEGLELIHDLVMDSGDKNDKIRMFKEEFLKKMAGFRKHMDWQYKKLKEMQSVARDKEQQIKNCWLEEAKAGKLTESFDNIPLSDSGFTLEEFNEVVDQDDADDGLGIKKCVSQESGPFQDKQSGKSITVPPPETYGSEILGPRGMPLEDPSTIPLLETVDVPMETEALASETPIMNIVTNEADDMSINYKSPATVANEKQSGAENSDISCLRSCPLESIEQGRSTDNGECASLATFHLENQADPSFSHAITSTGCDSGVLPHQEPHLSGHERPEDSSGLEVQGSGSLQEIPASNSADFGTTLVEPTDRNITVSDSFMNVAVCSGVHLVAGSQRSIAASGIEEEPSDQIQRSSRPNNMPMQDPVVSSSVLVGQSTSHPLVSQFYQSVFSNSDTRLQSISEDLPSTSTQPESVHYPIFPLAQYMPTQGLQPEPLKNELTRIRLNEDRITKMHDDRKFRLKLECDQELEKVKRKYDKLLQDAESEFLRNKDILETIYNKVFMNQVLAEEFRAKFIENKGGASSSSQGQRTLQQLLQASQPQFVQRSVSSSTSTPIPFPVTLPPAAALNSLTSARSAAPNSLASLRSSTSTPITLSATLPPAAAPNLLTSVGSSTSTSISLSANLPPAAAPNSLTSVRLRVPSISAGHTARQGNSAYPSNSGRLQFSPMPQPRANLQIGSETRAPAPHLQRFRANTSMSMSTPNVEFPVDVGDSRVAANIPNVSQLANLAPSFDSLFSMHVTSTTFGLAQPTVDVVRSAADSVVVCISDDD